MTATAAMPGTSMKIYYGEPVEGAVAESVKIGDPLTLVVSIDSQDIYGMHVTECYVRDGLGWSEQQLINEEGYRILLIICNFLKKIYFLTILAFDDNDEK